MNLIEYIIDYIINLINPNYKTKKEQRYDEEIAIKKDNDDFSRKCPLNEPRFSYTDGKLCKYWYTEYLYAGSRIVGVMKSYCFATEQEIEHFQRGRNSS